MNLQRILEDFGSIRLIGPMQWLIAASLLTSVVLLVALATLTRRHVRLRQELASTGRAEAAQRNSEVDTSMALEGVLLSPIDRVFPRNPLQFLMLVVIISAGTWLCGLLLAPSRQRFLTSQEWWFQPFYIAAHLVALRLFINVFTRNFAAGVSHLDVARPQAMRGIRPILGVRGAAIAALVALPFSVLDFAYLFTPRYQRMGGDETVRAIDYLMWSVWTLEWFINAFIWVLLIGFMFKNMMTIRRYAFRDPIHVVLEDKHYRPFLQMSTQSSTVVLAFSLVTVLYLIYTGGELTDYLGLGITVVLLVVGFVPPWLLLRTKVDTAVRLETMALRREAGLTAGAGPLGFAAAVAGGPGGEQDLALGKRVDEAVALLRIWHLHNLYGNLGQTEAKAIVFRLLAPAATIAWQIVHQGGLGQKLTGMVGGFLAK